MKNFKKIFTLILAIAMTASLFAGCASNDKETTNLTSDSSVESHLVNPVPDGGFNETTPSAFDESVVFASIEDLGEFEYKTVIFKMTDGQSFTMNVYPEIAPKTVENFLKLVGEGFYDGLIFHRVIDGFMAQGGDPEGTGMGGAPETVYGEFKSNGYYNPLSHQRGVVSMARSMDPNSASSQFFICYDDASFLDGDYAAFGIVTEGMEVVDSFLSAGTDASDKPLKDVIIESATIVE